MSIRYAIFSDRFSLKQIWSVCFGDEDDYVEHFLRERWNENNCLVAEEDGRVVSMLFLLPAEIIVAGERNPVWYVYACATLPEYRGRALMQQLLSTAFDAAILQSVFALVLVPASESLFNFYEKSGYNRLYKRSVKGLQMSANIKNQDEIVSEKSLADILSCRDSLLTRELDVCWGKDHLRFVLLDMVRNGGVFYFTNDGYALFENQDGRFVVKEQLPGVLKMTEEDYAMIRFCRPYTIESTLNPYFNLGLD